jgi:hypothetical protein
MKFATYLSILLLTFKLTFSKEFENENELLKFVSENKQEIEDNLSKLDDSFLFNTSNSTPTSTSSLTPLQTITYPRKTPINGPVTSDSELTIPYYILLIFSLII